MNCVKLYGVLIGMVALSYCLVAQEPKEPTAQMVQSRPRSQSFYKGYAIPNPDNPLAIAVLAANPIVAAELKMRPEQLEVLNQALQESDGALDIVRTTVIRRSGSDPVPSDEEIERKHAEIKNARLRLIEELFSSQQLARLRQIAYQVEVARVGLGRALTNGKLGEDAGVTENQKTALMEKAEQIQEKANKAIQRILQEAQDELLTELSAEQRAKAKGLLGRALVYRDIHFRNVNP